MSPLIIVNTLRTIGNQLETAELQNRGHEMSKEWFVRRGEIERGPLSSQELKRLVEKGTIVATDMIRKSDQPEWREAGVVRGLFPAESVARPAPPPLPSPAIDQPQQSEASPKPSMASETLKSGLADFMSTAKQAKDLASAHARKTQITQMILPKAYWALGKHLFENGSFHDEFSELFQRITTTNEEIAGIAAANSQRPPATDLKGKLQSGAAHVMAQGQTAKLNLRVDSLLKQLGKQAFESHGPSAGPSELVEPITSANEEISRLDAQIEQLSSGDKGPLWQRLPLAVLFTVICWPVGMLLVWLHPRLTRRTKTAWTGVSLAAFLILSLLVPKSENQVLLTQSSPQQSSTLTTPSSSNNDSKTNSSTKSFTSDDAVPSLPTEITKHQKWPELPLVKMPVQLGKDLPSDSNSYIFYSPSGKFVSVIVVSHQRTDLRLWNSTTGDELSAKSSECDYFSLPASFSPDESRLACLDGDFLRIWNLKTSPATLVQTLRLSKPNENDSWNTLRWGKPETLIVGVRPEYHNVFTYLRLRLKADSFSVDGPKRSSPRKYKGASVRFGTLVVSPDGNVAALAVVDDKRGSPVVQATEYDSEKELKEIILPNNDRPVAERFPHGAMQPKIETNYSYFTDKGSCIEFSPDGRFLLVATGVENQRKLKAIPTTNWQQPVDLTLGELSPGGRNSEERLQPRCFSSDGNLIAGLAIRKTSTSRGEKFNRVALVNDLVTGKRTAEIDLGEEFGAKGGDEQERLDREMATFSSDGKNLIVAVSRDLGWSNANKRAEGAWAIGSWNLSSGKQNFAISGVVEDSPIIRLAPNGETVVVSRRNAHQVWDVKRLAKLRADHDEGNRLWSERRHADALKLYCSVLGDEMAGVVCPDMALVWSRCIDAFAEGGEISKSRSIVLHLQQFDVALEMETLQGKKVVSDLLAEQEKARLQAEQKSREEEEKRLSEVRARNQSNRVVAVTLTKREFIDKLRTTASRGRFDESITNAVYEDFTFQDIFGDPHSNVEWVDRKRLYTYRCKDGLIQLTVFVLHSRTFLSGMNQF